MEVTALVDSQITIAKKDLDPVVIEQIFSALRIPNPDKQLAKREKIGGWWLMPDNIILYKDEEDRIILPRGFAEQLIEGLRDGVQWIDRMTITQDVVFSPVPIAIRDYQEHAVKMMQQKTQGLWQSPPGSGKTVTVLELIRRLGQRAVVIVNNANIAEQWRQRSRDFLGYDPGLFGDGVRDEQDLTICLQQTLWSRREELDAENWFDQWGFVCLDEVHHLPANTFTDILSRFPAYFRIGVSGTPFKQKELEEIVYSTVGSLILETKKDKLVEAGWLIEPKIVVYPTGFNKAFFSTHTNNPKDGRGECSAYKYCDRDPDKKRHQNNYADIMTALIQDDSRNQLIAANIVRELSEGHTILVLSRRLEHLTNLFERVSRQAGEDNLFYFTGKQSTAERLRIQERADAGSCVLFSTIADEALDIPRASRVHLAWPTKNTDIIRQQIGRIERPHPDKKDAVVNDYLDDVGPLRRQFEQRYASVYADLSVSMIESYHDN